jgi:hypothetical protein
MEITNGNRRRLIRAAIVGGALVAAAVAVPAAYAATAPVPTGFVQICKAGATTTVTGSFQFTISGVSAQVTVPVGGCSAPVKVNHGTATVTEVARAGFTLAAVAATPSDRLVSKDLATGKATVKVNAGNETSRTIVKFTNKVTPPPPPTGTLRVCKVAGTGVAAGTEFGFTIGTTKAAVKAGACSAPLTLPVGNVTVKETPLTGYGLGAVAVTGAGALVSTDLVAGSAVVKVAAGATDVSFTNKAVVVTGCVRGQGYYKNHPDVVKKLVTANGGTLAIGGVALTPAQLGAIYGRDSRNFLNQVSATLITARLNQLSGASNPAAVQAAIDAAQALEKAAGGPLTGKATADTKVTLNGVTYTASQLVGALGTFNGGASSGGPASCA